MGFGLFGLMFPVATIRKKLRKLVLPFWVLRGRERHSGEPLSVLWAGSKSHLAYLKGRLFETNFLDAKFVGHRPLFMTNWLLRSHACQVGVSLVKQISSSEPKLETDFRVPLWNECEIIFDKNNTTAKAGELLREVNKSLKNGLSGRICTRPGDLEWFFENIYLPSVTSSHGEAALPTSVERRLQQLADGTIELVQIVREGEVIAGTLIDYRGEVPVLKEIGVLHGSKEIKKLGAITATNVFAMDHVRAKGYARINFGLTRSFLNDGGLMYKRKFRPVVVSASDESLSFRICAIDPAVRSMLRFGSCVSWQNGKLSRTYFRDSARQSTEQVKRAPRSEWKFGIAFQTVYDIAGDRLERVESG